MFWLNIFLPHFFIVSECFSNILNNWFKTIFFSPIWSIIKIVSSFYFLWLVFQIIIKKALQLLSELFQEWQVLIGMWKVVVGKRHFPEWRDAHNLNSNHHFFQVNRSWNYRICHSLHKLSRRLPKRILHSGILLLRGVSVDDLLSKMKQSGIDDLAP